MARLYKYVGPDDVRLSVANCPTGFHIKSVNDLKNWINQTIQKQSRSGVIPTTFVVAKEGYLRLAERHCEHIACAGGEEVLAAGEMFFACNHKIIEVVEVSNQSTGYCPEPESWFQVAKALEQIPLPHPSHFTAEFIFRRCPVCRQLNIVKNNLFLCAVCNTNLPIVWNCDC